MTTPTNAAVAVLDSGPLPLRSPCLALFSALSPVGDAFGTGSNRQLAKGSSSVRRSKPGNATVVAALVLYRPVSRCEEGGRPRKTDNSMIHKMN